MPKKTLAILVMTTFVVFGILLSIGIGISANEKADNLESKIDDNESRLHDHESRIDDVERKLR